MINNLTKGGNYECKRGVPKSYFLSIFISLACLRNEEAITSTGSRIFSWQVFDFLLYWQSSILQDILFYIWYLTICFWIDWVHVYKYTKIKGLDSREITSLPESTKSDEHSMSFQSSLKMKQWKFTTADQLATPSAPVIEVLLIKIRLFLYHWFQSNQHFQVIEFVDQPIPEKL